MPAHLTDEQLAERLISPENTGGAAAHPGACADCRDEEERLQGLLARYSEAARAASARPEAFWQWQQAAIAARLTGGTRPWRLVWATATALVVFAAVLLIVRTPAPLPVVAADPDDVLLVDVERSVRREVPQALEPAALLAAEVSQNTKTRTNP